MMKKLYSDWMHRANKDFSTMADAVPIGYENAVLPFLVVAGGILTSVTLLVFEHLGKRDNKKKAWTNKI
jgi:hypothetical protein